MLQYMCMEKQSPTPLPNRADIAELYIFNLISLILGRDMEVIWMGMFLSG